MPNMASERDIFLIPPASVNNRWEKDTNKNLLAGIHAVDRYILLHAHKRVDAVNETLYGWYISPTLNGVLPEDYIFTSTSVRAELVFLCVAHASAECWKVHRYLRENAADLKQTTIKSYFARLRKVYFHLRDVAKPELLRWTCRPLIPEVAELHTDTIDFLIAYVCALYSLCSCLFMTSNGQSVSLRIWATMTLFVAERFAVAYTILYNRVWTNYGCQHLSAQEVAKSLSGYALYYYCKAYSTLLHETHFCDNTTARQRIALARCVEYLATALTEPAFGFAGTRITRYLEDMRGIVLEELPMCEEPVIGRERIHTAAEYDYMFAVVSPAIPESMNLMETIYRSSDRRHPYFVNDPGTGTYNVAHHGISTRRAQTATQRTKTTHTPSAQTTGGVRKPRFTMDE